MYGKKFNNVSRRRAGGAVQNSDKFDRVYKVEDVNVCCWPTCCEKDVMKKVKKKPFPKIRILLPQWQKVCCIKRNLKGSTSLSKE